jgi:GNAT superfamily N-acetyltransferase
VPAAARKTTTDASLAARAAAFDAGVFERAAEELRRVDGATLLAHPTLPRVPHVNTVLVAGEADADRVEAIAEALQADGPHRRVVVQDEAAGRRAAPELAARGWTAEALLLLGRPGALDPVEGPVRAEEVPYGHVRGLRDEWLRSGSWAISEEIVAEAHEADRRIFTATPTRAFAAFERGRPLSYALLLDGGRDGMLEDVYTTPEARGRGLSTSVIASVLHAARAEGHEWVFVPTDADGRARALYERLGFTPLLTQQRFFKALA